MKAVLISIQPKWCELIASGKKTVEVRKTKPKIETPFKCYIYCTKGEDLLTSVNGKVQKPNTIKIDLTIDSEIQELNGKVIGEFVCDNIITAECGNYCILPIEETQVDALDLLDYADMKTVYGWHITDLVIYDNPKELSEFYAEGDCDCMNCRNCAWFDRGNGYNVEDDCNLAYKGVAEHKSYKPIKRPPQSWCYVEERRGVI